MAFICCSMYDKDLDTCIGYCGHCPFTLDCADFDTWLLHGVYCMIVDVYMQTFMIIKWRYYGI